MAPSVERGYFEGFSETPRITISSTCGGEVGLWETIENSTVSLFSGPHPGPSETEAVIPPQQSIFRVFSRRVWHGLDFSLQHGIVQVEICPIAWETPAKKNMTAIARHAILIVLEFILD